MLARCCAHWLPLAGLTLLAIGAAPFATGQQPVQVQPAAMPQAPAPLPPPGLPAPPPVPQGLPPRGPGEELPERGPEILTLPDLEQMALGSNPSLARAQALVAAARGNW